jgi:hypothetical protein
MIIDPIFHITLKLVAHEWKNDTFGYGYYMIYKTSISTYLNIEVIFAMNLF